MLLRLCARSLYSAHLSQISLSLSLASGTGVAIPVSCRSGLGLLAPWRSVSRKVRGQRKAWTRVARGPSREHFFEYVPGMR
jgi:hypothetical protein